jgi:hypothetical protein
MNTEQGYVETGLVSVAADEYDAGTCIARVASDDLTISLHIYYHAAEKRMTVEPAPHQRPAPSLLIRDVERSDLEETLFELCDAGWKVGITAAGEDLINSVGNDHCWVEG